LEFADVPAESLFRRPAVQTFRAPVPEQDAPLQIPDQNGLARVVEQFGLLTQLLLVPQALGDIAQNDGVEFLPPGLDLRDRSFDGELLAVRAQPVDRPRPGHGARRRAATAEGSDV